jgi:hypothetical protein
MNSIFANTIYTGKTIVTDRYLIFKDSKITGIMKSAKGKWASFIGWNSDPFDLASYPVAVYGEGQRLFSESMPHSSPKNLDRQDI